MLSSRRRAPRRPAVRRRSAVAVSMLTACALLATACTVGPSRRPPLATSGTLPPTTTSSAPSSTMPTGPGGPGRTADPIAWTSCPTSVPDTAPDGTRLQVDCGGVPVPVSYTDASQGTFALRVARARSARTPADAPPLVVLWGEPGERGRSAAAEVAATLPAGIRDHFAIVTVDLRGTGSSNGIDCISDATERAIIGMAADPTSSKGSAQMESIARQLTFDCGDLVGPSLTEYNSTNAADDLDTLRAALGVTTIAMLGRGYGATIGAVYANRYPGRVAALVLDAPTDPLATPSRRAAASAAAAQSLLTDFAAACPGFRGGCPLGPDPASTVTDVVHRLASSGETAGSAVMTGGSVLLALLRVLPQENSWPDLAAAIASLRDRDAQPLADLLRRTLGGVRLPELLAARLVYRCNDTTARLAGKQLRDAVADAKAASPLFGPFTVAMAGLCSSWPAPDVALGRVSGAGAPPILVIGSVKDPLHPYTGVQSLAGQLASAVLVSWQSGADGAYPASSCVTGTVDRYLLSGAVPRLGELCPP